MSKKEKKKIKLPWEKEFDKSWKELADFLVLKYGTHIHPRHLERFIKSFISQTIHKETERAKEKWVGEIDKVYKKEQGIHNWQDLREKLLKGRREK